MSVQPVEERIGATAARLGGRITAIAGAALIAVLGLLVADVGHHHLLLGAAAGLLGLSLLIGAMGLLRQHRRIRQLRDIALLSEHDPAASLVSDPDGLICQLNPSATNLLRATPGDTMVGALRSYLDAPAPIVFRLLTKARLKGMGQEDVINRQGHAVLSAHRLGETDLLLWRLTPPLHRARPPDAAEVALPMLTASRAGTILYMNEALRQKVGTRAGQLEDLFTELPLDTGDRRDLRCAEGVERVQIVALPQAAGRREIYLCPISPLQEELQGWSRLDDLNIAFAKLSPEGQVLAINAQAAALLGCAPDCTGRALSEMVEGLGRPLEDWLQEAVRSPGLRRPEVLRAVRDDKDMYLQITLGRVEEQGRIAIAAVLNDATELKTLEAQFVQSQKMQAIGQLAGGVAHDFNNLLTAISGHCDLLLLRHDPGDPEYSDLQQINQNANRAAALVGQLLAFSRKQNLRPERIDLREALADLTHLLNRLVGEKITLVLSHEPDLRATRADRRQLEQVIMNLVVNARDAMAESGGEINLETSNVHFAEEYHRDRAMVPAGDYVCIRVRDTGCGISKDRRQKVFEPFYTTKRAGEGTGLGLSTVYGIVKQTGGFIFVDSEPGNGTTFSVLLPASTALDADAPATRDARPRGARQVAPDGGVILLVEDEAPVRAFASRALQMRGYTVLEAQDAEEALERLADPALKVDLFVTDVVMPGVDGPGWVRQALSARPDVPVVFVSGYAEESFAKEQAEIPNSVFLPKPFSLAELAETVQRQLG